MVVVCYIDAVPSPSGFPIISPHRGLKLRRENSQKYQKSAQHFSSGISAPQISFHHHDLMPFSTRFPRGISISGCAAVQTSRMHPIQLVRCAHFTLCSASPRNAFIWHPIDAIECPATGRVIEPVCSFNTSSTRIPPMS
jgi:hypothetical protein